MKFYQLKQQQHLPISVEEAWDFFSSPHNLKAITPDYMGFNILSGAERSIFAGQLIRYTVKPLLGIPMTWVTEITQVKHQEHFVDNQRYGPYSMWHHKHFFRAIKGGVAIEDVVDYKLPLGIFGQLAHAVFVKKQLESIFEYRKQKLENMFGCL